MTVSVHSFRTVMVVVVILKERLLAHVFFYVYDYAECKEHRVSGWERLSEFSREKCWRNINIYYNEAVTERRCTAPRVSSPRT